MKKFFSYACLIILSILLGSLCTYFLLNRHIDLSRISKSVVYIEATNGDFKSTGSGFAYKKTDGSTYIITSYHVVDGYMDVYVYNESKMKVKASILGFDELNDIAVLVISNDLDLESADIGNSNKINVGDDIFVVGTPLNIDYISTITSGIVSNISRNISFDTSMGNANVKAIQIDAPINPGNSGSPLLNKKGQVIGIVFVRESELNGIGFAIPINYVMEIVKDIESNSTSKPNLGAVMANTTNEEILDNYNINTYDINGVVLINVKKNGILYNAGMEDGDIIVEFNNIEISNVDDLKRELYKCRIGDVVNLKYYSNGHLEEIEIELE